MAINIQPIPVDMEIKNKRNGIAQFNRSNRLRIGSGDNIMMADKQGLWLGAKKFDNAPFRVDMEGNLVGLSLDAPTITGGTISGSSLSGSTITGGTVRTSSGGTRVEMNGGSNAFQSYLDGNKRAEITENRLSFFDTSGSVAGEIFPLGTANFTLYLDNLDGLTLEKGAIHPRGDGNTDLGKSSIEWRDIYLKNSPTVSSDIRFKKNIQPVKYGLKDIEKVNPISYEREGSDREHLGFSAQELQEVLPEIVNDGEQLSIRPDEVIPVLVNAVKELSEKVRELENRA
jgi:hypothetical protein